MQNSNQNQNSLNSNLNSNPEAHFSQASPTQPVENEYVLHRRFDRMGRLVGDEAMKQLFNTHVMVIGLGGVGSWAAESLIRSGVGRLTVLDFDEVCITNANRQLHAMQGMVGKKKALVMGERLQKINPQAKVEAHALFYNEENAEKIFAMQPDYIVDAIDNLTAKVHLLDQCVKRNIKVITSGGASAKMDPTRLQWADLGETHTDPMAHMVRKMMRQKYGYSKEKKFGIPCVFSDETPIDPVELHYDKGQGFKCVCPQGQNNLHSCEHRNVIYGTASFLTGTFGLHMAAWVVKDIIKAVGVNPSAGA